MAVVGICGSVAKIEDVTTGSVLESEVAIVAESRKRDNAPALFDMFVVSLGMYAVGGDDDEKKQDEYNFHIVAACAVCHFLWVLSANKGIFCH